mmetsp:Transcript_62468/g.136588  ORF Transcript_62468/g.136588 Transcript_62468/m.136588 type:complete len:346 (-) Transcript_62468:74-1111(-)
MTMAGDPPDVDQLLAEDIADNATMEWDPERFRFIGTLQEAPRNSGYVELCEDLHLHHRVAVKAMPRSWTCDSHQEFLVTHADENELPWRDIAAIRYLSQKRGLHCICQFIGLFSRNSEAKGAEICLVLSYCSGGDLFSWLEASVISTKCERETLARIFMRKVLNSVQQVHSCGIAHGDLSLENILLQHEEKNPDLAEVRLIDFGACTGARGQGLRGKPSYQAPEVHLCDEYDAFAADMFSLGVMAFTLAVGNYPWRSTRPFVCPCWKFHSQHGLQLYLAKRRVRVGDEVSSLAAVLSPSFIDFLSALLCVDPVQRISLPDALNHPWFLDSSSTTTSDFPTTSDSA